ncbi:hypothetical protein [Parvicella tangerina]|uniref:Uncharacterized protein n=1 Tax=Parvicella tangerina TaxID=2829795 RepID=A0A916JLW0_9FLAO|nr:hypothetical protein [Parvicella tangerina]CAG5080696.1 hypothetical protein CRYO30217_01421 [Parvicella tangerina]
MEFNHIEYKKPFYKIKQPLKAHLEQYSRFVKLPISYDDLVRYHDLIPLVDDEGEDTLWNAVLYGQSDIESIQKNLKLVYQMLSADGVEMPYVRIASIDFCSYGNSKPFRIKVVNELNDNHDYFYVKKADASRVYGLELEDTFSPDKITYLVDKETLVEEHIVGIPGDVFVKKHGEERVENRLRLAKEFVKFNERCFTRLLGDMRAYNFVVEITQDFDNVQYRIRAMDFDQQCYEGRKNMYLPQYYKDNIKFVELAQELMTIQVAEQYQKQERAAMKKRFLAAKQRTRSILRRLKTDNISTRDNINSLRNDLAHFHNNNDFLSCRTMGEVLILHLECQLGVRMFG